MASKRKTGGSSPSGETVRLQKAIASYNAGDLDGASRIYEQVLKSNSRQAEACFMLGIIHFRTGRNSRAVELIRQATEIDPGAQHYHMSLGVVLDATEAFDEAEGSFKRALELKHDDPVTWGALAETYRKCGLPGKALECLDKALSFAPDNPETHRLKGYLCYELDRTDESQAAYERALELKPDFPQALVSFGLLLRATGDRGGALEAFDKAVEVAPTMVAAQAYRAQLSPTAAGDGRIEALEQILGGEALILDDQQLARFALGRMYADTGDHAAAFENYHAGNELRRQTRGARFDLDVEIAGEEALCAGFDESFFKSLPEAGTQDERPVLVVGMPRSGTTLIERIIGSHPAAFGAGELTDIKSLRRQLTGGCPGTEIPECARALSTDLRRQAAAAYLDHLQSFAPQALRIVDKMPLNCEELWLVAMLLPGARVVHARRSPLDTCLSCYFTDFSQAHGYKNDLRILGLYYRRYRRMMEHWMRVLPLRFLDVQYETLVTRQEPESRRLIEFCGLDWDESCLEFHRGKHAVRTASSVQVRRRMYTSSVGRWRHYEEQLAPLMEALGEDLVAESRTLVDAVAGNGADG